MNDSTCTVKIPISSMNAKKKSASVAAVLWSAPARAAPVSEARDDVVEVVVAECCSASIVETGAAGADFAATCAASATAPPGADSRAAESRVDEDGARGSRAASRSRPASRGRIVPHDF